MLSRLHRVPPEPADETGSLPTGWPGRLAYDVVDVFTDRPFTGNPLAVVHGAEYLTTKQLQAIAKEFNLSETAFPMPPTQQEAAAGAHYRVRIFTPGGEVPFAGHPTLGTAWVLRRSAVLAPGDRVQACGAGLIGVSLPNELAGQVELTAEPRDPARSLAAADAEELATLVGLEGADLDGDGYAAGCGLTWLYLRVRPGSVGRARPSSRRVSETGVDQTGLRDPVDGVVVFAISEDGLPGATAGDFDLDVHCRVFVPGYGIPEDPATGSAGVALGLVLVASGRARPAGETTYRVLQGLEMGRRSLLYGRVQAADASAVVSRVAGQVVPVASGTIALPPS